MVQRIGVEAALDLSAFTRGAQQYERTMDRLVGTTEAASKAMSAAMTTASDTFSAVLGTAAKLAVGAVAGTTTALVGLGAAAYSFATSAAPIEGVMQGFAVSAAKAGKEAGVWLTEMKTASRGMVDELTLMRNANLALTGAGKELGEELGEALPTLLKGAQVAARRTGYDVNYLYNSLIAGVKRAQPMLIDNTGIIIKLGEANAQMAAEVGKSVEQLSAQEKQQAILRATLLATNEMLEEQGELVLTAGERLQQWRTTIVDTRAEIGLRLQPALSELVDGLQKLGTQVLPEVSDAFVLAGGAILRAGGIIAGELSDIAASGRGWGQDLGLSFAQGIRDAIPYIVGAIQAVGEIITAWLSPGSPPKVAPKIDQWGRELVQEYVGAFEDADLGGVTGFSRQLQETLRGAIAGGLLSEGEVAGMLGPLQSAFLALFTEVEAGGEASEASFARLRQAAGPLGSQMERIARSFVGVAGPQVAVETGASAEEIEALERAMRRYQDAVSTTEERIRRLYGDLAQLDEGSADYYDTLTNIRRLEAQRTSELDQVADAQFRYELAQADTARQIELYRKRLAETTEGSADWYDIQTTLYNLERRRADELQRIEEGQTAAGKATADGAAGSKKAEAEAKRLAVAELRWKLATATTAEQVEILTAELAKLEPGTEEWFNMAIQLANAQERLRKSVKAGGTGLADYGDQVEDTIGKVGKLPSFADAIADMFDPEKIQIDAAAIKDRILDQLAPLRDVAPAIALLLGGSLKDAVQAALFGAEAVITDWEWEVTETGEAFLKPTKKWVPRGGDKSWTDLRLELGNRIGDVIEGAVTDAFGIPILGKVVGNNWEALLVTGLILRSGPIQSALEGALHGIISAAVSAAFTRAAIAKAAAAAAAAAAPAAVPVAAPAVTGAGSAATLAAMTVPSPVTVALVGLAAALSGAYTGYKLLTDETSRKGVWDAAVAGATDLWDAADKFSEGLPGPNLGLPALFRSLGDLPNKIKGLQDLLGLGQPKQALPETPSPEMFLLPEAGATGIDKWIEDQKTKLDTFWQVTVPGLASSATETLSTAVSTYLAGPALKISAWRAQRAADFLQWAGTTVPLAVGSKIVELSTAVSTWLTGAETTLTQWWADRTTDFETFWGTTLPDTISGAATKLETAVNTLMSGLRGKIDDAADGIKRAIIDPFRSAYNSIRNWWNKLPGTALDIPEWPADAYALGTPSFPGGLALVGERGPEIVAPPRGSQIFTTDESRRMMRALAPSPVYMSPREAVGAAPAGSTHEATINIGPNAINNDMDLAVFEARVRRIVKEEVRG